MMFVSADTPLPFFPSRSDYHVLVAARNRVLMTGKGLLGARRDNECMPDFVQPVVRVAPGPD